MNINIKYLHSMAMMPMRGSPDAAGYDLFWTGEVEQKMTNRYLLGTGIAMEIPVGWVGLICPRSGLAINRGITVSNAPGVIDSDFRGEVKVCLEGGAHIPDVIARGDRIAQIVFIQHGSFRFVSSDSLDSTVRGGGGFGSTGQ